MNELMNKSQGSKSSDSFSAMAYLIIGVKVHVNLMLVLLDSKLYL